MAFITDYSWKINAETSPKIFGFITRFLAFGLLQKSLEMLEIISTFF